MCEASCAASKFSMPCAMNEAMMPVRTSPEPAVASAGFPVWLIANWSLFAMIVSFDFRTTVALNAIARFVAASICMSGCGRCLLICILYAFASLANSPGCGVSVRFALIVWGSIFNAESMFNPSASRTMLYCG